MGMSLASVFLQKKNIAKNAIELVDDIEQGMRRKWKVEHLISWTYDSIFYCE